MLNLNFDILLKLILFAQYLSVIQSASEELTSCSTGTDCASCISAHLSCSWCTSPDYDDVVYGASFRCATKDVLRERGCNEDSILNVESEIKFNPDSRTSSYKISPTSTSFSGRKDDMQKFNFSFSTPVKYPVDLYFLVDNSFTMRDKLETVSKMTKKIADGFQKKVDDLRLGYGIFVDKPTTPYIAKGMDKSDPCSGGKDYSCIPTFLMKHLMPLSDNFDEFQKLTSLKEFSGNLDPPEGGLDAMMQILLCDENIGWRPLARKVLVYSSDGGYHLEGDGKLAGILKAAPNSCKLNKKSDSKSSKSFWTYDESLQFDYPSVGALSSKLIEKGISIIFAVPEKWTDPYNTLSSYFASASTGILNDTGDNILELLLENYEKISQKVQLYVDHDSEAIEVMVKTKCDGVTTWKDTDVCDEMKVGAKVEYQLSVKVKKCFVGEKKIILKIFGYEAQSEIKVTSACTCKECDAKTKPSGMSKKCDNHGIFHCGACECSSGYTGDFCRCENNKYDELQYLNMCMEEGAASPCSGRGRCNCGRCVCSSPIFKGQFCQCNVGKCRKSEDTNEVCGGEKRGKCQCDGTCKCREGYSGAACDCPKDKSTCIPPGGKLQCKGRGVCECGRCYCNQGYMGTHCEQRDASGAASICENPHLKRCVECLHRTQIDDDDYELIDHPSGKEVPEKEGVKVTKKGIETCNADCESVNLDYNEVRIVRPENTFESTHDCVIFQDSCNINFEVQETIEEELNPKLKLAIVNELTCRQVIKWWWIVIIALLIVLILGIVLILIYKLVTSTMDRLEVARLKVDKGKNEINLNPMFKNPEQKIDNIAYEG